MVPGAGLEPARFSARDFKSLVSTNSTTRAKWRRIPESNWCTRICNPLHSHSANPPFYQHELSDFIYWNKSNLRKTFTTTKNIGAANETRTRDIHVGNVMLYQLSYSRLIYFVVLKRLVRLLYPVTSFADSLSTKTHSTSYYVTVNY